MQGLIAIFFIITQFAGSTAVEQTTEYVGQMPEIVVTAPRYEYEDDAWSGLMPEKVVTAPRYTNEEIMDAEVPPTTIVRAEKNKLMNDANMTKTNNQKPSFMKYCPSPNFAYAHSFENLNIKFIPVGNKVSGDYHVSEEDTIDEDVTVTGGNAEINGVIEGDLAVMGGTVDVGGKIDGDVAVFGGNLDIFGTITGDAAVFGGNISNKGTIEGDLAVIGGTVMLDSGSVVEGDINMVGGTVDRDKNAIVHGQIESIEIEALEKLLPRIGRIGRAFQWTRKLPSGGSIGGFIGISVLFVIYIVNLLILLIFPRAIDKTNEKIQLNIWASVGFGIGIQILYVPLIIIFAVSVIGILIIPVFVLAVALGILFGFSALSLIMGEKIINGLNWKIESRVGKFTVGWIAAMFILILGFIFQIFGLVLPIAFALGGIIVYVTATIGLGGVIYALVKREKKTSKK